MTNRYVNRVRNEAREFWKARGVFMYVPHFDDTAQVFDFCLELNDLRQIESPPRSTRRGDIFMPLHADDYEKALKYCQDLDRTRGRIK